MDFLNRVNGSPKYRKQKGQRPPEGCRRLEESKTATTSGAAK
jgi:hypothetical protein